MNYMLVSALELVIFPSRYNTGNPRGIPSALSEVELILDFDQACGVDDENPLSSVVTSISAVDVYKNCRRWH